MVGEVGFTISVKGDGTVIRQSRNAAGQFGPTTSIIVKNLADAARDSLKTHTPVATGDLRDSTEVTVSKSGSTWHINIGQHALSVEGIPISKLAGFGRGPGGAAPYVAIRDWILVKGIIPDPSLSSRRNKDGSSGRKRQSVQELAHAIRFSIGAFGTQKHQFGDPPYWEDAEDEIRFFLEEAVSNIRASIVASFKL